MIINKYFIFIICILLIISIYNQYKYNGGAVSNIIVKKKTTVATIDTIILESDGESKGNNFYTENESIDGYKLKKDDLILVKNQTHFNNNGLYKVLDILENPQKKIKLEKENTNNIRNTLYNIENGLVNKNAEFNLYYNIYNKYYKPNHYIFKLSNINNDSYEKKFILKSKFWVDSENNKNIAKPLINNVFSYNTNNNHIFSINGIELKLDDSSSKLIKSTIISTHILSPVIYLLNTNTAFIKIYEPDKTCFIEGIQIILINNSTDRLEFKAPFTDAARKEIFKMIYNKPVIIYIEIEYESNNLIINKPINLSDKTTSYIYEVLSFDNNLIVDRNTYIRTSNSKIDIFIDTATVIPLLQGTTKLISNLDGNIIQKIETKTVFKNTNIEIDHIQKQLLMNKKIINIDLLSTENIELTKINKTNNIVFKIEIINIDGIKLQNNFIIILKNQTDYKENGFYKYFNGYIYKQQFDKNIIKNKYFYIKNGNKNINNYWKLNIDDSLSQKNLSYDKVLNPIHQINQNNPYISLINKNQKCRVNGEMYDENTPCNKWDCDLRSKLGCLLFNKKLPINIDVMSTNNITLQNNLTLRDLKDKNCENIFKNYSSYINKLSIISDKEKKSYISNNIYKTNETSLDNIQIYNENLILLNHQNNKKENGIYKVICIKNNKDINFCEKLLFKFKRFYKKINSNKSSTYQFDDFSNIYPIKTIFEYNIHKNISNILLTEDNRCDEILLQIPLMTDTNKNVLLQQDQIECYHRIIWDKITSNIVDKTKITAERLLQHLKRFVLKIEFKIKKLYKSNYLLLEHIDLDYFSKYIKTIMPKINFPSYDLIYLYINEGINKDKFFKIKLDDSLPNTYKFIKVLESNLFYGGVSEWQKFVNRKYPYIPYKMARDKLCDSILANQAARTVQDLKEIEYKNENIGEQTKDLLLEFLTTILPDTYDLEYLFRIIAQFTTPFGFAAGPSLVMTCKSKRAFDEFFHYKRGRFWHYIDHVVDKTIDSLHFSPTSVEETPTTS